MGNDYRRLDNNQPFTKNGLHYITNAFSIHTYLDITCIHALGLLTFISFLKIYFQ